MLNKCHQKIGSIKMNNKRKYIALSAALVAAAGVGIAKISSDQAQNATTAPTTDEIVSICSQKGIKSLDADRAAEKGSAAFLMNGPAVTRASDAISACIDEQAAKVRTQFAFRIGPFVFGDGPK